METEELNCRNIPLAAMRKMNCKGGGGNKGRPDRKHCKASNDGNLKAAAWGCRGMNKQERSMELLIRVRAKLFKEDSTMILIFQD